MCTCKILRFIARATLGTLVALLLSGLVFAISQTIVKDWIMLAVVFVATLAFAGVVLGLIHLATRRCDGDR